MLIFTFISGDGLFFLGDGLGSVLGQVGTYKECWQLWWGGEGGGLWLQGGMAWGVGEGYWLTCV